MGQVIVRRRESNKPSHQLTMTIQSVKQYTIAKMVQNLHSLLIFIVFWKQNNHPSDIHSLNGRCNNYLNWNQ